MKIRIEFEIPNWTRWVAVGVAFGLVLGLGIGRLFAGTVELKTNWANGDVLTADSLNLNFQNIQTVLNAHEVAIAALGSPECPAGYVRDVSATSDPSAPSIVLCRKGKDELVKVGTGGAAFWIDRYEASIWSNPEGTGIEYGVTNSKEFPAGFPADGQYSIRLYALSVPQSPPSAHVSWFQADAACEASGKRLPTREEWLHAARGTRDPGESDGSFNTCVTSASAARNTGLGQACVSQWGAQDLIGNLSELTAEWFATDYTDGSSVSWATWPGDSYARDAILGVASVAYDNGWIPGIPTVASRGGNYADAVGAGVFALNAANSPNYQWGGIGFRCVVSR